MTCIIDLQHIMPDGMFISEGALTSDGFDDCIMGTTSKGLIVYDTKAVLEVLSYRDGMTQ